MGIEHMAISRYANYLDAISSDLDFVVGKTAQ